MKNSVIIKGNKYGMVVILDENLDFEELKSDIATKFKESSKFFDKAKTAISFEGRKLSNEEQRQVLDIIAQNSEINVICVIDNDLERQERFKKSLEEKLSEMSGNTGQFYKGTLRSGQVLELETSVIIMGDVNPGAKVISKGNIIIIGSLKGNAYAGANGSESAFVVALDMSPMQIRIGDTIARASDTPIKEIKREPKIAFVEDGNIYIESINKSVLNDIKLF